jgi:hypothetical protein
MKSVSISLSEFGLAVQPLHAVQHGSGIQNLAEYGRFLFGVVQTSAAPREAVLVGGGSLLSIT